MCIHCIVELRLSCKPLQFIIYINRLQASIARLPDSAPLEFSYETAGIRQDRCIWLYTGVICIHQVRPYTWVLTAYPLIELKRVWC